MKKTFLLGLLMVFHFVTFAQEEFSKLESEESESRHSFAFVISHSRIGQGRNSEGEKSFLVVPSLALHYNYWLNENWAIGLHTDFLNENFFIENGEGEILERERPVAPAIMAAFIPAENWSITFGIGKEFANEESFTLTRLSLEYGIEIKNGWEFFGVISQDFRWSAYDVTSFGFGIGKRL